MSLSKVPSIFSIASHERFLVTVNKKFMEFEKESCDRNDSTFTLLRKYKNLIRVVNEICDMQKTMNNERGKYLNNTYTDVHKLIRHEELVLQCSKRMTDCKILLLNHMIDTDTWLSNIRIFEKDHDDLHFDNKLNNLDVHLQFVQKLEVSRDKNMLYIQKLKEYYVNLRDKNKIRTRLQKLQHEILDEIIAIFE